MSTEKPNPEQEMQVLEGGPIKLTLCGQTREVKRMTIKKQRAALNVIQGLAFSVEKTDPVGKTFDMMIELIAVATDVSKEEINENSDAIEIAEGFRAIWKQNRFDFLLKTIGDLGAELTGQPTKA